MAGPGTRSDFVIYDEQFYGGQFEKLAQNTAAFNAASNGAIVLQPRNIKGDYERESFMKRVSGGLIARRDPTSTSAATAGKLEQAENIGVKLNRRIGPVSQTRDSWRKIAADPAEFSFKLGQMTAEEKMQEFANTTIAAIEAALLNQAAVTVSNTGATVTHANLVSGLSKFGDAAQRIVAWVMHSASYFQLMQQQIADKIYGAANLTIYGASVATLNRPVVVIDAPALVDIGTPTTYSILGLTAAAAMVTESEEQSIVLLPQVGSENLTDVLQGEYAYNVAIKGYSWHIASGANPDDTALTTGSNWDLVVSDVKNTAGVVIVHE